MKTIILALLLLVSSTAFADPWSTGDTVREAAYIGLDYMDWSTTRQLAAQPCNTKHCYNETNPFIPAHPSAAQINRLFIAGIALHISVSALLPDGFLRQTFQYGTIFIEATYVKNNYSLGFRAKF